MTDDINPVAPTATDAGDPDVDWRVLVPVAVLEGETVPDSIADLLATLPVTVLGYHVLPEQTPPGQARMQFEDRAQAKLDDIATLFRTADTRLVFTQDEEQTVDRVAEERGCGAVLLPNPTPPVERLLVPLGGEVNAPRIADFVAALVADREIRVTLLHVAESESAADADSPVADTARRLRDGGVSTVAEEVVLSETPVEAIAAAAEDHDVVVMGESEPSLRSFVFGEASERVADRSVGPVIVVRRPPKADR